MKDTDKDPLPHWLAKHTTCTIKEVAELFRVSRSTIDRWCRKNPAFPQKKKICYGDFDTTSTRFMVEDVRDYFRTLTSKPPDQQG